MHRYGGRHFTVQPGACDCPVALHCFGRYSEDSRSFFHREPAEEAELNNPNLAWFFLGQPFQSLVQRQNLFRLLLGKESVIQLNRVLASAALQTVAVARVVNQDTTHQFRGEGKELSSVLPPNSMLFHEAQKSFVDERRGDKCVTEPFVAKVMVRKAPKFVIDKPNYPFVAFTLGLKQPVQEDGYFASHGHPRERLILSLALYWCNLFGYSVISPTRTCFSGSASCWGRPSEHFLSRIWNKKRPSRKVTQGTTRVGSEPPGQS